MTDIWRFLSFFHWVFLVIAVLVAFQIIMENRNPYRTLAWIFALAAFPLFSIIGYLLTGRNLSWRTMRRPQIGPEFPYTRKLLKNSGFEQKFSSNLLITRCFNRTGQPPYTWRNQVQVLRNGVETFPAIFQAIESAKHHVHLEYYTIMDDQLGNRLKDLLIKKALEGVQVRVLYDGIGSNGLRDPFLESLTEAGVEVGVFLPVRLPNPSSRINYHDHRKLVIVDGTTGFIGGLNFGDPYLTGGKFTSWRDTHLQIRGHAVHAMQELFLCDWGFVTGKDQVSDDYFPDWDGDEICCVQITPNGPNDEWRFIFRSYFELITLASQTVYITTPYFIPDETLVMALETAAIAGADVRILLPYYPDRRLVQWAGRSYYLRLLKAGVKIYEYKQGFLHAKILLVDGLIASVGTANLDTRSMEINFEVNATIYDAKICQELTDHFFNDLEGSDEIKYEDWTNRPGSARVKESIARLFSPIL